MTSTDSPFQNLSERLSKESNPVQCDAIDLQLLKLLLADARATLKSLAEAVGLSSPAVSERMQRLSNEGIIRGYKADIDWARFGYTMLVYLSVVIRSNRNRDAVLQELALVPNIEEVSVVTGSSDLILRIRVTGFDHLKLVIAEHIWSRDDLEFTETKVAFFTEQDTTVEMKRLEYLDAMFE